MFVRAIRAAVVLVVSAGAFGGLAATGAQAPYPISQSSGNVGALAQAAVVVYSQPPSPAGGLLPSSLRDPDGSATDQWAWDGFTLALL